MTKVLHQASRFALVGLVATGTHFVLALTLIHFGTPPLVANLAAFGGAFWISYLGHAHWSFFDQDHAGQSTLRRFVIVSCFSFLVNELILATLITFSPLSIEASLLLTLIATAGITFFLAKLWAFQPATKI